jgi:hypothetical protein
VVKHVDAAGLHGFLHLLSPWRVLSIFLKGTVSSLYEATENELQGSGMAISKMRPGVLNSEKNHLPSTSALKLKLKIDTSYSNIFFDSKEI